MRTLLRFSCVTLLCASFLGGCIIVRPKLHSPGHVKQATGINPASGKIKGK